jgi:hypothetical protein
MPEMHPSNAAAEMRSLLQKRKQGTQPSHGPIQKKKKLCHVKKEARLFRHLPFLDENQLF